MYKRLKLIILSFLFILCLKCSIQVSANYSYTYYIDKVPDEIMDEFYADNCKIKLTKSDSSFSIEKRTIYVNKNKQSEVLLYIGKYINYKCSYLNFDELQYDASSSYSDFAKCFSSEYKNYNIVFNRKVKTRNKFFMQAFRSFILNPKKLKKNCPMTYKYFKSLLKYNFSNKVTEEELDTNLQSLGINFINYDYLGYYEKRELWKNIKLISSRVINNFNNLGYSLEFFTDFRGYGGMFSSKYRVYEDNKILLWVYGTSSIIHEFGHFVDFSKDDELLNSGFYSSNSDSFGVSYACSKSYLSSTYPYANISNMECFAVFYDAIIRGSSYKTKFRKNCTELYNLVSACIASY